jgi:hypothetical protein
VNNLFESATPEQKLSILTNLLLTPIETIRGFTHIVKKDIESNNVSTEKLLESITIIIEMADKIKTLRDQAVG